MQTEKPPQDRLFAVASIEEDFVFNKHVAEVFDDMLSRSIPCYKEVIACQARLLAAYLNKGDTVCDLGCSTGTTLLQFSRILAEKEFSYVGVDNSSAMLEKAEIKIKNYAKQDIIRFIHGDISEACTLHSNAFIVNYTLQFIRPLLREKFLQNLYTALQPGGILLLSEKTISHDRRLNREFIDIYHGFKKTHGYSELEIAKKREALENVLIPFSIAENRVLLEQVGFSPVETFFQWFNFVSFIAVKPR